ncbi:MAG: hypothetical protein ACJ75J_01480 [Cytophagaceae bacterium]
MKTAKLIEYCELLNTRGPAIGSISNMILFSPFRRNDFFADLGGYIGFYSDVKQALLKHFKDEDPFKVEVQKLPDLHFEDYSISPITFFIFMLMFPLASILFLLQMSYLKQIRKQMKEVLRINAEILIKLKREIQ